MGYYYRGRDITRKILKDIEMVLNNKDIKTNMELIRKKMLDAMANTDIGNIIMNYTNN